MLEEGILRVIRGLERPVFLRVPLGVILSVFKVTVISVISRVVVILGTETSSSLESCSLRCPVNRRRWELEKMCRNDVCCFGPLGLRGLRLSLGGPLPFVHLHPGDWPWCVSKSELQKKKAYHPSFLSNLKPSGAFPQIASFRTLCGWKGRWPRAETVFSIHIEITNTEMWTFVPTEDWFLVYSHKQFKIQSQFAFFFFESSDEFSRCEILHSISEEVWMSVSEDERTEFRDRNENGRFMISVSGLWRPLKGEFCGLAYFFECCKLFLWCLGACWVRISMTLGNRVIGRC